MRWSHLMTASLLLSCGEDLTSPPDNRMDGDGETFRPADRCAGCHPLQYTEWKGSIMSYAAVSPVFNAFELTARELSKGMVAADGELPNFCVRCHSPIGDHLGELPGFRDLSPPMAAQASLSPLGLEAVTCDFCHTVQGPDKEGSLEKDGIANFALDFEPGGTKRGPLDDPTMTTYHMAASSDYLRSSEFCGACHDVRLPKPDIITREPVQRVENLFTEWARSSFAARSNRFGRVISCQDCHMSLYPMTEPGVYPTTEIAAGGKPDRPHALHAFTAVSVPLIDDPRFPNVDTNQVDEFGFPMGQEQRRTQMLKAACVVALDATPKTWSPTSSTIPIQVEVKNVGAGHSVPSGFSQERQVWLHLRVEDDLGLLYESGYLEDQAHPETGEDQPDGKLDDEDLQDHLKNIEVTDWTVTSTPGPDMNQRPVKNLGLISFTNAFRARDDSAELHDVVNPLAADGIDNFRALAAGVSYRFRYDVPKPNREVRGAIQVSVRLLYRPLPPVLLRILAVRHPDLLNEAMIDRNAVIEMTSASTEITAE